MKIVSAHISTIRVGDTVLCEDGHLRTVGKNNIGFDSFVGKTLLGDSYNLGQKPVKKCLYKGK